MCKKIVEYHGGRIWLRHRARPDRHASDVGSGAVFYWTLPVAAVGEDNEPDTESGVKQEPDA